MDLGNQKRKVHAEIHKEVGRVGRRIIIDRVGNKTGAKVARGDQVLRGRNVRSCRKQFCDGSPSFGSHDTRRGRNERSGDKSQVLL